MAISMLSRTTSEMTLYVPNMVAPMNSVNSCRALTLVTYRFNRPNMDQNSDCSVSNSLRGGSRRRVMRRVICNLPAEKDDLDSFRSQLHQTNAILSLCFCTCRCCLITRLPLLGCSFSSSFCSLFCSDLSAVCVTDVATARAPEFLMKQQLAERAGVGASVCGVLFLFLLPRIFVLGWGSVTDRCLGL